MDTVGIRDLKAHLSRHLKRVRAGARLAVTERGKVIATIAPVESKANLGWAHDLVTGGHARWDGGKPTGGPPVRVTRGRTASAVVVEDRR